MKPFFIFSIFFLPFSFVSAQSWQQQAVFPGLQRDDAVAVVVGDKAYYGLGLAVGFTNQQDWWSYDTVNGWQQKTTFPGIARQYAAATALGKYVYVFGGLDPAINSLNDLWRYDTENDSWEQLSSLLSLGRQAPMMVGLQEKIILGMGRTGTTYFDDVWQYDPILDTFEQADNFPGGGRYYPVYANVEGNAVLVHGKGTTDCYDDCYYYSTGDEEWMQMAFSPHTACNYAVAASHGYNLFIGGGLNTNNDFLNTYYEFNLRSNTWNALPDLPSIPRKGASMFVLDGALYLVGGIDSNYTRLNEVWQYDFIEIEPAKMEISPNPVSNYLNIYLDESMREYCDETFIVSLYDISGKLILQNEEDRNGLGLWFFLDVSALKAGMYIVNIENCTGLRSEKVVVE